MRGVAVFALALGLLAVYGAPAPVERAGVDPLVEGFANPPASARPRTWWHWMSNFITKEGITRDLEAMARVGVGGATIFDICEMNTHGSVKTLSDEWYALLQHAGREADRLGLSLGFSNCPGWSSSGGPWITPENAMKMLGWSEMTVDGGCRVRVKLPDVEAPLGWRRDVAVLAFPSRPGDRYDTRAYEPVTREGPALPSKDGLRTGASFTFAFAAPVELGSVVLDFGPRFRDYNLNHAARWEIAVSDDGRTFRTHRVTDYVMKAPPARIVSFTPVRTRHVRVTAVEVGRGGRGLADLIGISFNPAVRVPQFRRKAMHEFYRNAFSRIPDVPFDDTMECPEGHAVDPAEIVDLTNRLGADGTLDWEAPEGVWTVQRFVNYVRQSGNHPVNPEAHGLECDKLSKAGVDAALGGMTSRIMADAKASGVKAFQSTLIDSYEVGPQNWTDLLPQEFKRRTGYDITPWLPVLAGRYIRSSEASERFLEDFRAVLADLFAENYGDYFASVCHAKGLELEDETYCGPFDYVRTGRAADVPMGEFWHGAPTSLGTGNLPGNIADVFGRTFVQTETFTAGDRGAGWSSYPGDHKLQGDAAYCAGVNRFVFHSYAHQPFDTPGPGLTMGKWGFHFNRHNTLWEFYPGWLSYLSRAQYLLQQGRSVADALYVMRENQPAHLDLEPALPFGYKANGIDAQSFREMVTFSDGRLRLPGGMSYPLLVVADTASVSAVLLEKVRALVAAGADVWLGPRPKRAFGLRGGAAEERRVAALAEELWSADRLGRGRVWRGGTPGEVLRQLGVRPDFSFGDATEMGAIHRTLPDREIYFVANLSERTNGARTVTGVFRATGRPEFWNALDGTITPVRDCSERDGFTRIPLRLPSAGSIFIVFRRDARESAAGRSVLTFQPGDAEPRDVLDLSADWTVCFPPNRGVAEGPHAFPKLVRFDESADFGMRHFSGTAVYRKDFVFTPGEGRYVLEAGDVHDVARVFVNGRDCGFLWTPPYRIDVTDALVAGENRLEIRLANRWKNRVIGDEHQSEVGDWAGKETYYTTGPVTLLLKGFPDWFTAGQQAPEGHFAFTTARPWSKDSPLAPAGLEGPIRLRALVDGQ